MQTDYTEIFNKKVAEAIKDDWFPEQDLPTTFKRDLQRVLPFATHNMTGLTLEEYEAVALFAGSNDTTAKMPVVFAALQILYPATPEKLGLYPPLWVLRQRGYNAIYSKWQECSKPHIDRITQEVNAMAKSEQIRNNLKAGGHKGLARQISLQGQ